MSLLSDLSMRAAIENGDLAITPFDRTMVQPSSLDVRLDDTFLVFNNNQHGFIDPAVEQPDLYTEVRAVGAFILHPGEFVLAATYEAIGLGFDLAARMEGKSSLGRLGLLTHATAGFIDPGFVGHITLELSNVANLPIKLYPGMKIGQLCFFQMSTPVDKPYGFSGLGSRYQGQRGPTASRSWKNFRSGFDSSGEVS